MYVYECKCFPCPIHIYFQLPVNMGKNLRERTLKVRCIAVFLLAVEVYGEQLCKCMSGCCFFST